MDIGTRISIVGCGGAGKSTLALQLGRRLGLEVIHLDAHFWRPGWVETPKDEWPQIVEQLAARDHWIIDGNYGGTMEVRLAASHTVIFLDFPRRICLWRVLKRRLVNRGKTRPDVGPGCPESIDFEFLKWICYSFPRHSRPALLQRLAQLGDGKKVIVLRSPRQVKHFLAALG